MIYNIIHSKNLIYINTKTNDIILHYYKITLHINITMVTLTFYHRTI